jgi:hypothetical protein
MAGNECYVQSNTWDGREKERRTIQLLAHEIAMAKNLICEKYSPKIGLDLLVRATGDITLVNDPIVIRGALTYRALDELCERCVNEYNVSASLVDAEWEPVVNRHGINKDMSLENLEIDIQFTRYGC